jgi:hypothetical protein
MGKTEPPRDRGKYTEGERRGDKVGGRGEDTGRGRGRRQRGRNKWIEKAIMLLGKWQE